MIRLELSQKIVYANLGGFLGFPPSLGASHVAQLVKIPPAMQETWVQSLGWEDPLEKGKATHSSTLAWRISCTLHGVEKNQTGSGSGKIFLLLERLGFPASAWNAGDLGSIPELGRSPGVGNGNPLYYSFMEHSMDREIW